MGSFRPARAGRAGLRPYPGARETARRLLAYSEDSALVASHAGLRPDPGRLQPALRPAGDGRVLGRDRATSSSQLEVEFNSVNDNPVVFAESNEVVSAGLFHAQPVGDGRRLPEDRGGRDRGALRAAHRPAGRRGDPTDCRPRSPARRVSSSGYMMAQYTAAALVSENKVLAHPASVDSIPTGAGIEDHVSMAPIAARHARDGGRELGARGGARAPVRLPRARVPAPAHRRPGLGAALRRGAPPGAGARGRSPAHRTVRDADALGALGRARASSPRRCSQT